MNKRIKKIKGDYRIRRTWDIHPATRIKDSDKIYDRKQEKRREQRLLDLDDHTVGDNGYYD